MSQRQPNPIPAPAPEPWSLWSAETLDQLVKQALPPEHQAYASQVVSLFLALGMGPVTHGVGGSGVTVDPRLRPALAALRGRRLSHQGRGISFEHAQTGDISIGPVAAGDQYNIVVALPSFAERPAPVSLPFGPNRLFCGRAEELSRLERLLLVEPHGHVVLNGIAGVGKTALAAEFAYRHRARFPGGVFWLTVDNSESIQPLIDTLAGKYGLPDWQEKTLEERVTAMQDFWARPAAQLIIFDGLEAIGLLDRWWPPVGGVRLLITSRVGFWPSGFAVTTEQLRPLPRKESIALLLAPHNQRLRRSGVPAQERAPANEICELLGDLPIALALAGAFIDESPNMSLAEYREGLAAELLAHDSLSPLDSGVAASIGLSYGRLRPEDGADAAAMGLLHQVALLPPALAPPALLARLARRKGGASARSQRLDPVLKRLAQVGLVEWLPKGKIVMHRLVAAYVRDIGLGEAGVEAIWPEVAAAVIDEAARINGEGAPKEMLSLLPHLRALATTARPIAAGNRAQLLKELGWHLWQAGAAAEARQWLEQALGICTGSGELRGSDLHGRILNNLALALQDLGDDAAAHDLLVQALAIQERLYMGRHELVASTLDNLAVSLERLGEEDRALAAYRRAQKLRRQLFGKEHPHYADSLGNLAGLYLDRGRTARAEKLFQAALGIFTRHYGPKHPMAALALHNLGEVSLARKAHGQAATRLEQALQIWNGAVARDHPDRADTLHLLATALWRQAGPMLALELDGRPDPQAERLMAQALNHAAEAHRIRAAVLGSAHPATLASEELKYKILKRTTDEDEPRRAVALGGQ
jgi:tetratricopeptide (TPR) repeat protein